MEVQMNQEGLDINPLSDHGVRLQNAANEKFQEEDMRRRKAEETLAKIAENDGLCFETCRDNYP